MAVPKKRQSKARKRKRRAHLALLPANLSACGVCGEPIQPHRACPECGHYKGKQIYEP